MAYLIKMPKIAMGMNEGIILDWFVDIGETVSEGDPILQFESEKTTTDIEANEDGPLRKKYVQAGEAVPPGTILGIVADADADISSLEAEVDRAPVEAGSEVASGEPDPKPGASNQSPDQRIRASPKARKRARQAGVSLAEVGGSGPGGAITVSDVEAALTDSTGDTQTVTAPAGEDDDSTVRMTPKARRLARDLDVDAASISGTGPKGAITVSDLTKDGGDAANRQASAVTDREEGPPPREIQERPLDGMRHTISERLGRSYREAVHVTVHREVPVPEVLEAANIVDEYVEHDATVMDVLVVALSGTLAAHPTFNSTYEEETISIHGSQHIGIAVDLEEGLVTPVVRNVESRSLSELIAARRAVTQQVLDGEYMSQDLEGGTFTVSNLGGLGVDSFTPIINPPQVAILGVDRIRDRVVECNGEITAVPHIGLDLSFDHRIVDGADAARFLDTLAGHLQHPWPLLLERA